MKPVLLVVLLALSGVLTGCGRIGYETVASVVPGTGAIDPAAMPGAIGSDVIGLGDGHFGALEVNTSSRVINDFDVLGADVAAGSMQVTTSGMTAFAANDVVMLWQVATLVQPQPPSDAPLALEGLSTGHWEFVRVRSSTSTSIELATPLRNDYRAQGSQVVRVPEYTSVHIADGANLGAEGWTGSTGGILVFLATGLVSVEGTIEADREGFPGGEAIRSQAATDCSGPDEPAPNGAQKGGGVFGGPEALKTGRSPYANGGGGGVCNTSGGGAGGHGGAGGIGGYSIDGQRLVGGDGGARLDYALPGRLSMGGGGGAAHTTTMGLNPASGNPGGGVIFFRAARVTTSSSSQVSAEGWAGSPGPAAGMGGAGAGGAIVIDATESIDCARTISAAGGPLRTQSSGGGGGGGGGGKIFLRAPRVTCNASAAGGGLSSASASSNGATAGADGTTEIVIP